MEDDKQGSSMNIYQRINGVRQAISYVQKDKAVSAGAGGSYKAVTHDAVIGHVRAHLIAAGIVIVPTLIEATFHTKELDAKQRLYQARYRIDFVNCDAPDDRFPVEIEAHALDNGDKAPGKALSYATKYAILKVFAIETGEDDESRYQPDEPEGFNVIPYLEMLEACTSLEELALMHTKLNPIVRESRDREALQTYIKVKDRMKEQIEKAIAAEKEEGAQQ